MSDQLITQERLMEVFKIGTRPALIRYLSENKIPFKTSPNSSVWTTQRAIDNALLEDIKHEEWEFKHAT